MSNESPFFLTKIECPLCKTVNEFETIKVGSFTENGRDTDFCPVDIQWRYPKYSEYNPLAFFTAVCSNCFYTREFNNSFKDWKSDNNFRSYRLKNIKSKHLDILAQSDSVIRRLGEAIDLHRYPNQSAIIKLHLAIYDELLSERISNLDLGRFYLRIGWVFRSMHHEGDTNVNPIQSLFLDVDNKMGIYRQSIDSSIEELQIFQRHLDAQFNADNFPNEVKSQIYPYKERFEKEFSDMSAELRSVKEKIKSFVNLYNEYKAVALGGDPSGAGFYSFNGFSSFEEYLNDIKRNWNEAVVSEDEALAKAIQYYTAAFKDGKEIPPGNQQLQASYMIAELSRRVGDHENARDYFNNTIKYGQDFIYKNRTDKSRTALARKILELAVEQGKLNMEALKTSA